MCILTRARPLVNAEGSVMQKKQLGGDLLLLMTAAVWGLAFTAQKIAGERVPPFALNGIRFLLGALVLLPVIVIFDRVRKTGRRLFSGRNPHFIDLTRREVCGGVACGAALLAATILQQFGLLTASPGKASFLTALYTVFVPFFGLMRRKRSPANVWISVAIAVGGAYLLTMGAGGGAFTGGDLILLLSAALFGLHITLVDVFAVGSDGFRLSCVQFATAGLLAIPGALVQGFAFGAAPTAPDLLFALPYLLYLGVCSTGFAYTSQIVGQQFSASPTVASLIMSLESVFGLIGGALFLHERMAVHEIAGCAAILFSVVFSQLPVGVWLDRVRRRAPAAEIPTAPAVKPNAAGDSSEDAPAEDEVPPRT